MRREDHDRSKENSSAQSRLTHRERAFMESSKEDIAELIESVKKKSFLQKIEDAYDASVKAHEIGFPSSVSRSKKLLPKE